MPATKRTLTFTESDLQDRPDYSSLEPGSYEAVITSVKDIDSKDGTNNGYRWEVSVQGIPLRFDTWLKGKKGSPLWKLRQLVVAAGGDIAEAGSLTFDPNRYVGRTLVAVVGIEVSDFNFNEDGTPKQYKAITRLEPLVDDSALTELEESLAARSEVEGLEEL